jgi:UDP-2,3-diacylglucosamine pyrophosphatase LpxH
MPMTRDSMILRREPAVRLPRASTSPGEPKRFRTVWVSDVHLGTRACKAEELLAFLDAHPAERLYLVCDILDGWKLARGWTWTEAQTRLVQRVLDAVQRGTDVVYVPGNHDEALRRFGRVVLAGVRVKQQVVHELADGRRALVLHGDQFDGSVARHRLLAGIGDRLYSLALGLNALLDAGLRALGLRPWSISAFLKQRVKRVLNDAAGFEDAVAREAARWGVDAVICGHIHKAEMRRIAGVLYANDGDWVESCTGVTESFEGELRLVAWENGRARVLALDPPARPVETGAVPALGLS